jgi:hypothetical protein
LSAVGSPSRSASDAAASAGWVKRCSCFGGVGEAVQLGEMQRAVGVFDVAEYAAGADRGELLIITDQTLAPRSMANCTAASRVRVSAMPASSMIIKVAGADRVRPVGQLAMIK